MTAHIMDVFFDESEGTNYSNLPILAYATIQFIYMNAVNIGEIVGYFLDVMRKNPSEKKKLLALYILGQLFAHQTPPEFTAFNLGKIFEAARSVYRVAHDDSSVVKNAALIVMMEMRMQVESRGHYRLKDGLYEIIGS